MDSTLLNKRAKFGAKIFTNYWVITFQVLGHFLKPHPVNNDCVLKHYDALGTLLQKSFLRMFGSTLKKLINPLLWSFCVVLSWTVRSSVITQNVVEKFLGLQISREIGIRIVGLLLIFNRTLKNISI